MFVLIATYGHSSFFNSSGPIAKVLYLMFDILHATKNLGGQGDFVCLPISVPSLPTSAFDPLALAAETPAAVQGNMASLNGQAGLRV